MLGNLPALQGIVRGHCICLCSLTTHKCAPSAAALRTCVEDKHVRPLVQQLADPDVEAPCQHEQAVGQQRIGGAWQDAWGGLFYEFKEQACLRRDGCAPKQQL